MTRESPATSVETLNPHMPFFGGGGVVSLLLLSRYIQDMHCRPAVCLSASSLIITQYAAIGLVHAMPSAQRTISTTDRPRATREAVPGDPFSISSERGNLQETPTPQYLRSWGGAGSLTSRLVMLVMCGHRVLGRLTSTSDWCMLCPMACLLMPEVEQTTLHAQCLSRRSQLEA